MRKIRISAASAQMTAELNDSRTADLLWDALPVEAESRRWGAEVYFDVGFAAEEENPRATVPSGTIAYWPPGTAFCIFFGETPAGPVNVLGQVDGDPQEFDRVQTGEKIKLERVE